MLSPEVTDFTVPTLSYGVASTLSATSNVPGTFTFRDGTTAICPNVVQNGSNTSTCNYTPDRSSAITFTVDFIPTSASYASLTNQRATPVTPSKAVLNVVPANINVGFGGTPSYAFSYTGFLNSENSSSSSFTTGLIAPTCSASSYSTSSEVSASPMQITCSGGSATNYTFNYSSTSILTIVQATPTLSDFGVLPGTLPPPPARIKLNADTGPGTSQAARARQAMRSKPGTIQSFLSFFISAFLIPIKRALARHTW